MKSRSLLLAGITLAISLLNLRGDGGREPGASINLSAKLPLTEAAGDDCIFSTEFEPVTFNITSFKSTYKVIRIRVENRSTKLIKLSPEKDAIELSLDGRAPVKGTLNLRAQDAATWNSLSDEMRTALAYPTSIRSAKTGEAFSGRTEVTYFFAFFPADKVPDVPLTLTYTIESLGKTLVLKAPPPTKS